MKSKPGMLTAIIAGVVVIGSMKAYVERAPTPIVPMAASEVEKVQPVRESLSNCQAAMDLLQAESCRDKAAPQSMDEIRALPAVIHQAMLEFQSPSCQMFLRTGEAHIHISSSKSRNISVKTPCAASRWTSCRYAVAVQAK